MKPVFEVALGNLERQKTAFSRRLSALDPAFLDIRLTADSWSVRDVLEHLVLVERAIVPILQKAVAQRKFIGQPWPLCSISSRMKMLFLRQALRRPVRAKAPNTKVLPQGRESAETLLAEWPNWTRELSKVCEAAEHRDFFRRAIFYHGIVGAITLPHTVEFIGEHIFHHQFQLDRILASVGR